MGERTGQIHELFAMERDNSYASRRLAVLAQQLAPTSNDETLLNRIDTKSQPSTSYASIDGCPSSYARVHGEVSRAPAVWRRIDVVAKEQLQEVIYEKAEGEGIAKVWAGV